MKLVYKNKDYSVPYLMEQEAFDNLSLVNQLEYDQNPYCIISNMYTKKSLAAYTKDLEIFKLSKKPSNDWLFMKNIYLLFKMDNNSQLTYTKEDELIMFNHESSGVPINTNNGFYWCKHNMDITLTMWKEDIQKGMLFKADILFDEKYQKYISWFENWLSNIYVLPTSLLYRKV